MAQGNPFRVNPAGDQPDQFAIDSDAAGNLIAVWTTNSAQSLSAQRFDTAGEMVRMMD